MAASVNNRHQCARVAIHSHIYEPDFEGNMFGFEFSVPKSCMGNIEAALDTAVEELDAVAEDFYESMNKAFPSED